MKKVSLTPFLKASLVITGLAFLFLVGGIFGLNHWFQSAEFATEGIFFRSWESKTIHGEPVYNKVKYIKKRDQEIWMMNQSHHGFRAPAEQLDRLAIVVKNKSADFYQLPPGPLEWSDKLLQQKIDLKVDCTQCHSSGPRALRPAPDFKSLMTTQEKMTVFFLNLRIKFYGSIENNLWMHDKLLEKNDSQALNLKTCLHCHNGGNERWSRSTLNLQQRETIRFLVENQQMPPVGFKLTDAQRTELQNFLAQRQKN